MSDSDSSTPPLKTCTKCGRELQATSEFFSPHKRSLYGVRSDCKKCAAAYSRAYAVAHRKPRRTVAERFWSKVKIGSPDECWPWLGYKRERGYGRIYVNGRERPVARVAWSLANDRAWPEGMEACHTCDNTQCVNPDHIFPGTHTDNMQDCLVKGRKNAPRGERHGSRTHPERVPRGARNGARMHPERMPRGSRHGCAKLTEAKVDAIRRRYAAGGITHQDLAREYGVSKCTVGAIIRGRIWKHTLLAGDGG